MRDVTAEDDLRRENQLPHQQIQDLKLTDDLTGLPNRRAISQAPELQISRSRRHRNPLSVVLVHIGLQDDQVELLRDSADPLVLGVSRFLRDRLRWVDQIGRWEENIFLLVLPETEQADARGLPRIFHPLLAFPGSQWMEDVVPRTGRGKAREGLFSRLQAHLPLTPLFVNVPGQHSPEVILAPVAQPRCRTGVDKGKRLREGTGFAGYCARRSRQL